MIISRTPFRISFLGGVTDYPEWFLENNGAVLATTIDKYCYIYCRYLPSYFEHKSRIVYSQMEYVQDNKNIGHPAVRECLSNMGINEGVEIYHDRDLPSKRGLGSSSSFVVGLLNGLHSLKGWEIPPEPLARKAVYVERIMIGESVGCQDQYLASLGGFRHIEFKGVDIDIHSVDSGELQDFLMLFDTGTFRVASNIAQNVIEQIPYKRDELTAIYKMVQEGVELLESKDYITFGKLLHEGWQLKRSLSDRISTSIIDSLYETALKNGAIGGKLLGAGGGGFLLLFAEPDKHKQIKDAMRGLLYVPIRFETYGSKVIFKDSS